MTINVLYITASDEFIFFSLCNAPDTTNISALGTLIIFLIEVFNVLYIFNIQLNNISQGGHSNFSEGSNFSKVD